MYDSCAQWYAHKYEQFFNLCSVGVRLVFVFLIGFICIFVYFCVSLDHFGFVLLVLLGLFFSVPSQEIGLEEHLRNDLFCVEWDVKPRCIHPFIPARDHKF